MAIPGARTIDAAANMGPAIGGLKNRKHAIFLSLFKGIDRDANKDVATSFIGLNDRSIHSRTSNIFLPALVIVSSTWRPWPSPTLVRGSAGLEVECFVTPVGYLIGNLNCSIQSSMTPRQMATLAMQSPSGCITAHGR